MDRIFNDACDKNVAAVIVYANSSKKLFYDAAFKTAVPATDCLNLFQKGVICKDSTGNYHAAAGCTAAGVIDFGLA